MQAELTSVPTSLSPQQLAKADELTLLQFHLAATHQDEEMVKLIQAEVARRIRFDLFDSVFVYNAFMDAYKMAA